MLRDWPISVSMMVRWLLVSLLFIWAGWKAWVPFLGEVYIYEAALTAPSVAEDPFVRDSSADKPQGLEPNHWLWKAPQTAGNWGLEAMRIPQLWNLNDAIKRHSNRVLTGVLDAGFQDDNADGWNDHPDLAHIRLTTCCLGR